MGAFAGLDGRNLGLAGLVALKPRIDLDELVELVDLPDRLFQWSLEVATGEVHPGPSDGVQLMPLPTLTDEQILHWMGAFAAQATESRIQSLLAAALRYPAPERRFREVLSVNPHAQREWEVYFDQQRRAILVDWLDSLGFEPSSSADV
jgi:hypothetical protein